MTVTFGQQDGVPRRRRPLMSAEPALLPDVAALLARRRAAGDVLRRHQTDDLDETREDAD